MSGQGVLVVGAFGLLAVLGGGLATKVLLHLVDRRDAGEAHGVEEAASILRGGTWIGALERLAIFAGLVAGWRESIAIVLAVKGLGRYPELRNGSDTPAVAERFIIGTFASVLWACGCAGLASWLR